MKKIIYSTLVILGLGAVLLALLLFTAAISKVVAPDSFEEAPKNIPRVSQGDYLPDGLRDLRMNMPLAEFANTVHGQYGTHEDKGFRQTVTTAYGDTEFSAVRFYFDSDDDQPLYEFIIEFPEDFDLSSYVSKKYGEPTHEGEWRFRDHENYYIMIWRHSFANRLIIAANIRGSAQQYRK